MTTDKQRPASPPDLLDLFWTDVAPILERYVQQRLEAEAAHSAGDGQPRLPVHGLPLSQFARLIQEGCQGVHEGLPPTHPSWAKWLELVKAELPAQPSAAAADAFKSYVHKRLDDFGVPSDPEPEQNRAHGCRIEGRLNYLFAMVKGAAAGQGAQPDELVARIGNALMANDPLWHENTSLREIIEIVLREAGQPIVPPKE